MSVRPHLRALLVVVVLEELLTGYACAQVNSEAKPERAVLLVSPPFLRGTALTLDDARAIEAEGGPAVVGVAPVVNARAEVVAGAKRWVPTYIWGTTPKFLGVRDWKLDQGRMWTDEEQRGNAKVCVLGATAAKELFGGQSPLGKTVRVKGSPLKVIGTLTRKGPNALGLDQDDTLLAPVGTVHEAVKVAAKPPLGGAGRVGCVVYVRVGSEKEVPAAVGRVTAILRKRHRLGPGQSDDFEIRYLGQLVHAPG